MSLQLWLPLNGDYENQGLSDIEMTCAAPSWSDAGKIGKCANFNGSTNNMIYSNTTKFNYVDNVSFALWLYHTGVGGYAFTNGRADMGGYGYGIRIVSSTQIGVWFGSHCATVNCSANTWHHVVGVMESEWFHVYIDGALKYSTTGLSKPTYSDGNGVGLGGFKYVSGNLYPFSGKINDFRIYDHALSPKEVKEISKGLVLHYPLNNNGMGCKNYIKDSYYVKPTICAWGNSTYARTQVEIDDEYFTGTFWKFTRGASGSGDVRIGWGESRIPIDPNIYNDNPLQFSIWVKSTTGTALTVYSARMSDQEHSSMGTFNIPANKWTKVECSRTFLSSSSAANVNELEIYLHISYNTDAVFAKAKLEVADRPTPWCPNEADELYSQLGMDENIEYDTSGYRNNGTKIGILDYESSSPRYNVSSYFNGINSGIYKIPTCLNSTSSDFTISFWYKPSVVSNGAIINCRNMVGEGVSIFWVNQQLRFDTGVDAQWSTGKTLQLNTWYHIVFTRNSSYKKLYVNGQIYNSSTIVGYLTTLGKYMSIGISSSDDGLSDVNPLPGNLSDFRIYSTCLSDSDTQELYNKPISIDNQGNMFAVEAIEETSSGPQFSQSGIVKADTISRCLYNYFTYDGPMYTGIQQNVDITKLPENNGLKLTCNSAVTSRIILHRMQNLMFNGASGDFKVEFDAWATAPTNIICDICDKEFGSFDLTTNKQHFSGIAQGVNAYNTSATPYNGFFDIENRSLPLGTEIYITNIVITKNTPKSIGSNYIVMDDIIEY